MPPEEAWPEAIKAETELKIARTGMRCLSFVAVTFLASATYSCSQPDSATIENKNWNSNIKQIA